MCHPDDPVRVPRRLFESRSLSNTSGTTQTASGTALAAMSIGSSMKTGSCAAGT